MTKRTGKKSGLFMLLFVAVALLVPFAVPLPAQTGPEKPYNNSRFVKLQNGVKIHCRFWKTGSDSRYVLLLPGFAGHTYSWRKNIPALVEQGFNVLAVDLPPFGFSDKNLDVDLSPTGRAMMAWEAAKHFYDGRWNIIGHSMGGGVVLEMAVIDSVCTQSLTIVDGAYVNRKGVRILGRILLDNFLVKRLADVSGHYLGTRWLFEKGIESAYREEATESEITEYRRPFLISQAYSGVLDLFSNGDKALLSNEEKKINVPALIIWGSDDLWVPVSNSEKIRKFCSNSTFRVINGAAHNPMETDPVEFNKILLDFLPEE